MHIPDSFSGSNNWAYQLSAALCSFKNVTVKKFHTNAMLQKINFSAKELLELGVNMYSLIGKG
jgi:hypothetical protein